MSLKRYEKLKCLFAFLSDIVEEKRKVVCEENGSPHQLDFELDFPSFSNTFYKWAKWHRSVNKWVEQGS